MISILSRRVTFGAFAAAATFTSLALGAAFVPSAANARSGASYYAVELAQPVAAKTTTIAGGVAWACSGTTCVAQKGSSRPLRVCRELQRQHGQIVSFTAKDKELDADNLAKCNG